MILFSTLKNIIQIRRSDEWKIELERNIKIMSQNMESNEMDLIFLMKAELGGSAKKSESGLLEAFNCDPSWPYQYIFFIFD